ncbi:MAG TPA: hypothetical protein VHR66_17540 [Gemmataceae bacterium]|nr:hypothetical protein [Gemmataceae bacterium]
MRVFLRVSLVLALLVAATSCSGKRTNITGTITRDGKPLEWKSEGGHLLVIFVPVPRRENQDPYLAETDREAGTYRIDEIRAGRYMVAIHQFDERHGDSLANKYDPVHTPLIVEVEEDGQVIDIDLPKDLPQ